MICFATLPYFCECGGVGLLLGWLARAECVKRKDWMKVRRWRWRNNWAGHPFCSVALLQHLSLSLSPLSAAAETTHALALANIGTACARRIFTSILLSLSLTFVVLVVAVLHAPCTNTTRHDTARHVAAVARISMYHQIIVCNKVKRTNRRLEQLWFSAVIRHPNSNDDTTYWRMCVRHFCCW